MKKLFVLLFILISLFSFESTFVRTENSDTFFHEETKWTVQTSLKYEALCFLNALTGDSYYLKYYQNDYDYFKEKFTVDVKMSIGALNMTRKVSGIILSASLTYLFSICESEDTLDALIEDIKDSDEVFKNQIEIGSLDNGTKFLFNEFIKNNLIVIMEFLRDNDFEEYWKKYKYPAIKYKANSIRKFVNENNIVPIIEKHLGFPLESNEINIYLLYFNEPNGIKLLGNNFITGVAYDKNVIMRNAIHEMMHPPANFSNEEFIKSVDLWKKDEFMMNVFKNHNPTFGYNDYYSFVEENFVDSLEIYIAEKIGLEVDPANIFKTHDEGMDVLGGALYSLMKEEGYCGNGETFQEFIIRIANNELKPGTIEEMYTKLVDGEK